ncbi:MAG: ATP-binding protein, partial [Clostridia bacterium]|nr:ATP-binding protein [Clostridia bacterium]
SLDVHVIGGVSPVGICGSGLVDAVACLLDNETIDETGFVEDDEITLLSPVTLTKKDIRGVQLAKSAIYSGIKTLLDDECVKESEVSALYVAGGFGTYLDKQNAGRIGLIPEGLLPVTEAVGNSALDGACELLFYKNLREKAKNISKSAKTVELSTDKNFSEYFISGMLFPEKD